MLVNISLVKVSHTAKLLTPGQVYLLNPVGIHLLIAAVQVQPLLTRQLQKSLSLALPTYRSNP